MLTILKAIVLCLVLANIGYFLWAHGVASSQAVAVGGDAAAPLKLASEAIIESRIPVADPAGVIGARSGAAHEPARDEKTANLLGSVARCLSVGPFRDVAEAAHAATTLRSGGYDPRQRVAEGDIWAGMWVYLPLPASRSAGEQMMSKLKAAGIEDALEMPGPNDGPVMSLGLFSEAKRAQARVAQAQALGFDPGITERKRTGNQYWIDVDLKSSDASLNPADLQSDGTRTARLEVKACPAAAGARS